MTQPARTGDSEDGASVVQVALLQHKRYDLFWAMDLGSHRCRWAISRVLLNLRYSSHVHKQFRYSLWVSLLGGVPRNDRRNYEHMSVVSDSSIC